MSQWKLFHLAGKADGLSHLNSFLHTFVQPAKGELPARTYTVQVEFGLHCFTREAGRNDDLQGPLAVTHRRETRIFDLRRYERSKELAAIVRRLPEQACFHTKRSANFLTIKSVNAAGAVDSYEVYFSVRRMVAARRLFLIVKSAYVRDSGHGNKPAKKKVDFFVILHKRSEGAPVTDHPFVLPASNEKGPLKGPFKK